MSRDHNTAEAYRNNRVGPILRASSITSGVIDARGKTIRGRRFASTTSAHTCASTPTAN